MKHKKKKITAYNMFLAFVYIIMTFLAFLCIIPLLNILAVSLSSQSEVAAGKVFLTPQKFTLEAYQVVIRQTAFWKSFAVSIIRVIVGTVGNIAFTLLMAYPMSKSNKFLPGRTAVMGLIIFVMLFNGGLVPTYLLMRDLNLLGNYLILILPGLLPVFNVILIMNFIRMLPSELEEAAIIDGAGFFRTLWSVIIPTCKPVIATVALFSGVGHWNDYFSGLIYLDINQYPLQTFLYTMNVNRDISNLEQALLFANINDQTLTSAQMFIALIPVLVVYPFLQKYFVKGIVLGAVKG